MADAMPAGLFAEWREFARLEPFGFPVEELRSGRLNATVANFRPFRAADAPWLAPADFMLDPDREAPAGPTSTLEERKARWRSVAKATGGYRGG
jgi:hypothetical protein